MPSFTRNYLTLFHPDRLMLKKAEEAFNSGRFLSVMIPEPECEKPDVDRSDWRRENWGTEFDFGRLPDHELYEIVSSSIEVQFDTPSGPPLPAYEKLERQGFDFEFYYCNDYDDFVG